MGWKQWSAVVVVIGGGVLLQIPGHKAMVMDVDTEMDHEVMGPLRTVALDVTGMT